MEFENNQFIIWNESMNKGIAMLEFYLEKYKIYEHCKFGGKYSNFHVNI